MEHLVPTAIEKITGIATSKTSILVTVSASAALVTDYLTVHQVFKK
jgi:hypothetical protein